MCCSLETHVTHTTKVTIMSLTCVRDLRLHWCCCYYLLQFATHQQANISLPLYSKYPKYFTVLDLCPQILTHILYLDHALTEESFVSHLPAFASNHFKTKTRETTCPLIRMRIPCSSLWYVSPDGRGPVHE